MLLQVCDLSVRLCGASKDLVRETSLALNTGKSLVILGQSGSGKTLTCKALMGVLNRRKLEVKGRILFDGVDLLTLPAKGQREIYGSQIAMIPQNPMTALDPSVRIGEQMAETFRLHTKATRAQAREHSLEALQEAGLADCQQVWCSYPHMLSGGMLQRAIIAMALMTKARLIVADEPTTALDAEHKMMTVDTFLRLRKQGAAILLVTHDFAVAARMGGDLVVMKDGNIVETGRTHDILKAPMHAYTRRLIEATRLSRGEERSAAAC